RPSAGRPHPDHGPAGVGRRAARHGHAHARPARLPRHVPRIRPPGRPGHRPHARRRPAQPGGHRFGCPPHQADPAGVGGALGGPRGRHGPGRARGGLPARAGAGAAGGRPRHAGHAAVTAREDVLQPLARLRGDSVVVTTMGAVRPWGRLSSDPLDFASADSAMGHAADFALGVALAQPARKVICLNGDGSMLMSLGTLVTIVASGATNFVLFVLENDTYETTGNQPVPGAGRVDFAGLARAAGFARVHAFAEAGAFAAALPGILAGPGPVCVTIK